jgi:hypothetical protein
MAGNNPYFPPAAAYAGFGISEGLRKHMEYLQQQKQEQARVQQFQQELDFRRQSAETEAMQRADELAAREKQFNKAAAADSAKLDFEREKFKEDKKQWEEEFPVRKKYMEDTAGAREKTAGAAVTSAGAAVTRAQNTAGGGKGKEIYTPGGLGKVYADLWTKNFTEVAKTYSKDFTNIYSDEKLYNEAYDKATEATRKAATPFLNAYNSFVDSNPTAIGFSKMSWDDLEALPQVEARKKGNPVDVKAAKDWNAVQNDKTFTSRFESLDLTDKELDLLRINAADLYNVYRDKIREKGSDKLKNKIAADAAEKARQRMVDKNADKR